MAEMAQIMGSTQQSMGATRTQQLNPARSSLRVKPTLDPLAHERQEIERRRMRDAERTKRLLHAKTRLYGIDTLALDQQVQEKQEVARLELERDLYYDDLAVQHARSIKEQEAWRQKEQSKKNREYAAYRAEQAKEKRRKELLAESAVRNYQDMNTTFLKFAGEDLGKDARVKAQRKQQEDWLAQQIMELQAREQDDRQSDLDYDAMQDRIREIQAEAEQRARLQRMQKNYAVKNYNKEMAEAKEEQEERLKRTQQMLEDMEITNQLNSKLLCEGVSPDDGRTNFKGFTTSQRQAILDVQRAQQEELAARRLREQQEEKDYAVVQEDIRRAMIRADRAAAARRNQRNLDVSQELKIQAKEKQMRYDYLDNVVRANQITEEFFDQFGRSCR